MQRHSTAASSMTSRGRSSATTRQRDAERQRHGRAGACGPTESRTAPVRGSPPSASAIAARAVGSPDGSSQPGSSPMTTAEARASRPAWPQLRDHAIQPIRPLADLLEEQHVSGRRREGERRPERRQQLRQRAAQQRAGALRPAGSSRAPAAPARPSARGRHSAATNDAAIVARFAAARGGRRASARETTRRRSRPSGTASSDVRSL